MIRTPRSHGLVAASLAMLAAGVTAPAPALAQAPASSLQSRPLSPRETPAATAPATLDRARTWQVAPKANSPTAPAAAVAAPAQRAPAAAVATPAQRAPDAAMAAPAAGAKKVVPDNVFSMEDRAIIIVGGRPVPAGDVKKQIRAELQRQSGPVKTARSASRNGAAQAHMKLLSNDGNVMSNDKFKGPLLKPSAGASPYLQPGVAAASQAANPNLVRPASPIVGSVATRQPGIIEARDYCTKHAPSIDRVRGTVTPNGRFTIEGMCFGERTGSVEVIGQFPGGNMRLTFEQWTETKIVAFVPVVRGAWDHAVAVTVVRQDKVRTPAAQGKFVATRERIELPERHWTPDEHFDRTDVNHGGGDIFSGYVSYGPPGSRSTPFTVTVNPQCALDNAAWSSSVGRIAAVNGWENGPPHEGKIDVIWYPQCTTKSTDYVFASTSTQTCRVAFDLKAWAYCPAGVAP